MESIRKLLRTGKGCGAAVSLVAISGLALPTSSLACESRPEQAALSGESQQIERTVPRRLVQSMSDGRLSPENIRSAPPSTAGAESGPIERRLRPGSADPAGTGDVQMSRSSARVSN